MGNSEQKTRERLSDSETLDIRFGGSGFPSDKVKGVVAPGSCWWVGVQAKVNETEEVNEL